MTRDDARHTAYHLGHRLGPWFPCPLPDFAYAVCTHPGCAASLLGYQRDDPAVGPALPPNDLMPALVHELPSPNLPWPAERRDAWLAAARATSRLYYGERRSGPD